MHAIVEQLNNLAEIQARQDVIRMQKQDLLDALITPEIKAKMAEIEVEFSPILESLATRQTEVETSIKADLLDVGETVKGDHLMAVYVKRREGGWDNGKLKGFAMAHPEILAAKKPDGEPTVSIRKV